MLQTEETECAKAQRLDLRKHSMHGKSRLPYVAGVPGLGVGESVVGDEAGKAGTARLVTLGWRQYHPTRSIRKCEGSF